MSLHYQIELYFPVDSVDAAFIELIKIVDQRNNQPYDVHLSNGSIITTYASPIKLPSLFHEQNGVDSIGLETVILFPLDVIIQAYMEQEDALFVGDDRFPKSSELIVVKDGKKHFPVGYLSVGIENGKRYAELSIRSVAGSQNKMIRYSPSIHRVLINLLNAHNGVVGLINVETDDYILLTDTSRTIHQDREPFDDGRDIDAIATDLITRLTK